jgi:hypothetical protein
VELSNFDHEHRRTRILISPDGSRILHHYENDSNEEDGVSGERGLHVQELNQLNPQKLIPGNAFSNKPFWKYDSQEVGYIVDGRLWAVDINGGQARPIATLPEGFRWHPWAEGGGAWLSDGRIVFTEGRGAPAAGLWEVSDSAGDPNLILGLEEGEVAFKCPSPLPDGRGVVFLVESESNETDIIAVYTEGERKTVFELPGESFAFVVYDPRGYLLFDRASTSPGIWALPFSLDGMNRTGEPPFLVADGTDPSVSEDGTLLYLEGTSSHDTVTHQLVWLNEEGNVERIPDMRSQPMGRNVRLSADDTQALVEVFDNDRKQTSIWRHLLDRPGIAKAISNPPDGRSDLDPLWHPDGDHILFHRTSIGENIYSSYRLPGSIMKARLDGEGETAEIVENAFEFSLSGDGRYLVYETVAFDDPTRSVIAYLDFDQEGVGPQYLKGKNISRRGPQLSSDGRYLAYLEGDGVAQLFLTPFPSADEPWQVSSETVGRCFWGRNPAQPTLYYYNSRGFAMSCVTIAFADAGGAPVFGEPKRIFNVNSKGFHHSTLSDPVRDGRRFLVPQRTDFGVQNKRKVVLDQNWLREFEDRSRQ